MKILCEGTLASSLGAARSTRRPVALLWCDVGELSDLVGLGDADASRSALGEYHQRFKEAMRRSDHFISHDGTLLLVVAVGLGDTQDAAGVAYRLLAEAVEPVRVGSEELNLTWAIGIAVGDSDSAPSDMMAQAEEAYTQAETFGGFAISDLR